MFHYKQFNPSFYNLASDIVKRFAMTVVIFLNFYRTLKIGDETQCPKLNTKLLLLLFKLIPHIIDLFE